jgi:hypothetical protein
LRAGAYAGHANVVRMFLDHGADVNAQGGRLGSALIAACQKGHLAAAKVLIDIGADMDIICIYKGKSSQYRGVHQKYPACSAPAAKGG